MRTLYRRSNIQLAAGWFLWHVPGVGFQHKPCVKAEMSRDNSSPYRLTAMPVGVNTRLTMYSSAVFILIFVVSLCGAVLNNYDRMCDNSEYYECAHCTVVR